jgi:Tfp pilus assembly protein PilF
MTTKRLLFPVLFLGLTCAPACFAQTSPTPPPAQTQTAAYNPMLAAHDVQVGEFYMKRADTDGAIARFKDALLHKPNYAEPCLLLGRAYEQKHDPSNAIRYYQQYLKILPNASESKKVRKRIAELRNEMKKGESASGKGNR